jgi:hypothetical protein
MGWIINSIERKNRLQITIVILIIVVISIWIPYSTDAKEYRYHITKKASRGLTFVKSSDILRTNFELYIESPHKSESRIYDLPMAAAYSSADLSAGHLCLMYHLRRKHIRSCSIIRNNNERKKGI